MRVFIEKFILCCVKLKRLLLLSWPNKISNQTNCIDIYGNQFIDQTTYVMPLLIVIFNPHPYLNQL